MYKLSHRHKGIWIHGDQSLVFGNKILFNLKALRITPLVQLNINKQACYARHANSKKAEEISLEKTSDLLSNSAVNLQAKKRSESSETSDKVVNDGINQVVLEKEGLRREDTTLIQNKKRSKKNKAEQTPKELDDIDPQEKKMDNIDYKKKELDNATQDQQEQQADDMDDQKKRLDNVDNQKQHIHSLDPEINENDDIIKDAINIFNVDFETKKNDASMEFPRSEKAPNNRENRFRNIDKKFQGVDFTGSSSGSVSNKNMSHTLTEAIIERQSRKPFFPNIILDKESRVEYLRNRRLEDIQFAPHPVIIDLGYSDITKNSYRKEFLESLDKIYSINETLDYPLPVTLADFHDDIEKNLSEVNFDKKGLFKKEKRPIQEVIDLSNCIYLCTGEKPHNHNISPNTTVIMSGLHTSHENEDIVLERARSLNIPVYSMPYIRASTNLPFDEFFHLLSVYFMTKDWGQIRKFRHYRPDQYNSRALSKHTIEELVNAVITRNEKIMKLKREEQKKIGRERLRELRNALNLN